jgi:hypothetical protein
VLDDLRVKDVVHYAALFVDLQGRQETTGSLRAIRAGFPDIRYTVDGVVAEGDKVLVWWTGEGTHEGPFLGFAPRRGQRLPRHEGVPVCVREIRRRLVGSGRAHHPSPDRRAPAGTILRLEKD